MGLSAIDYLNLVAEAHQLPNFWCAEEYFEKAGWGVHERSGFLGVFDRDGEKMLPEFSMFPVKLIDCDDAWAGFSTIPANWGGRDLDFEFIYNPTSFMNLSGPNWHMTRKNLRWAEADMGEKVFLDSRVIVTTTVEKEIANFVANWAEDNKDKEYYDPEVMLDYLLNGKNRFFLRGATTKYLYGILAYDTNWKYINFRYCAVINGVRGLSDTARVLFYQKIARTCPGVLVNDGGSLGNEGLYRYKLRLNPLKVSKIRTYKKEDK